MSPFAFELKKKTQNHWGANTPVENLSLGLHIQYVHALVIDYYRMPKDESS